MNTIIYACSGCSDAGELADRIARRLTHEGAGQMSCLAGIGGRVKPLLRTAERADQILVIDGCPLNCARHTLQKAGFTRFRHLALEEIGLHKSQCAVTEERIAAGVRAARQLIQAPPETTSQAGQRRGSAGNTIRQAPKWAD